MTRGRRLLALGLLSLAAGGCASLRLGAPADAPAPALHAGVPTADQLAAPYRAQAEQHERAGRLRQAAEAWTTALALAPDHEPSRQSLRRLRERIEREIADQMQRGWHALGRDDAPEARRHFLAALALDPDSRAAREALRATPAPPALDAEPRSSNLGVRPAALTPVAKPVPAPEPRSLETEKPEALYAAAKSHLASHRDDEAYRALTRLAHARPGYRDSAILLRELRPRLARQRYQEGLRLLREERLEEAIARWRGVLEIDGQHADARRSIEQAEKMLRTLAAQPKR